jgi:hypothetical protein
MPTLKSVLENLDDLDASLHEMYAEKDGKFVLNIDNIEEHPGAVALKNALDKQKQARAKLAEENKVLKERLAKIPDDFDPDEIAHLKATIEEMEKDPNRQKGDKAAQEAVAARKMLEEKIKTMEKSHEKEVGAMKTKLAKKDAFIGQLLIDDGLTKALIEAGIDKAYLKAAKALLRPNVTVEEEDDDAYKAIVKTDTGDLDVPKFVQDWIASDEGKPFIPPAKGADAGNAGKPGGKPAGSGEKNPWMKEHWNETEQGRMFRADRAKAEKFAKAAGRTLPRIPGQQS